MTDAVTRGKKLARQLARYLGSEVAEDGLKQLATYLRQQPNLPISAEIVGIVENLPELFNIIDSSYQKYEDNLAMAERNLSLSTEELVQANNAVNSMVNSLGQGFLSFDNKGICLPVYSKACETLLEVTPVGKHISSVLRVTGETKERLEALLAFVFEGTYAMEFTELLRFAPDYFQNDKGQYIKLDYKPDFAADGSVHRIVMIATDMTEQRIAQELADERKALFDSVENVLHDRQSFGAFMRHTVDFIQHMSVAAIKNDLNGFRREVHTLKGGAGVFRLIKLVDIFHEFETELGSLLTESVGEMPLAILEDFHSRLKIEVEAIIERFREILGIDVLKLESETTFDVNAVYDFARYLVAQGHSQLSQEFVQRVCMRPIRDCLEHFNLQLKDLAERFNKKVYPINFIGSDLPILPTLYRPLFESFVHIFRNIMDHGIEAPHERTHLGKDETGTVEIRTRLKSDAECTWLIFEIEDDGIGVDTPRLRAKLSAQDPAGNWPERSEHEVLQSLLTHSISLHDVITIHSGRGVGMAAVHDEVKRIGGKMVVSSMLGRGMKTQITVPYSTELIEPNKIQIPSAVTTVA